MLKEQEPRSTQNAASRARTLQKLDDEPTSAGTLRYWLSGALTMPPSALGRRDDHGTEVSYPLEQHFTYEEFVPMPQQVRDQLNQYQRERNREEPILGLLPQIEHGYMVLKRRLWLWNYSNYLGSAGGSGVVGGGQGGAYLGGANGGGEPTR